MSDETNQTPELEDVMKDALGVVGAQVKKLSERKRWTYAILRMPRIGWIGFIEGRTITLKDPADAGNFSAGMQIRLFHKIKIGRPKKRVGGLTVAAVDKARGIVAFTCPVKEGIPDAAPDDAIMRKHEVSKFNPAVAQLILDYVTEGSYLDVAAAAAGISRTTFCNWMRRGAREGHGEIYEWTQKLHKARSMAEHACVQGIMRAGLGGQWQALAWRLQHMSDKYQRSNPVDIVQLATLLLAINGDSRRTLEVAKRLGIKLTAEEAQKIAAGADVDVPRVEEP